MVAVENSEVLTETGVNSASSRDNNVTLGESKLTPNAYVVARLRKTARVHKSKWLSRNVYVAPPGTAYHTATSLGKKKTLQEGDARDIRPSTSGTAHYFGSFRALDDTCSSYAHTAGQLTVRDKLESSASA